MRNAAERLKFIKPQEPILVLEPPLSDDWLHEIKYDGFRTQLILDWAGARAFTRTGIDWSKRYWPVVDAAEKLKAKSFILDGEMIAPEPDGRPNFHAMHSRMAWNAELLAFVAFDIMHLDGQDLRALPAIERKAILWEMVKPADGIIQYSQHVEGNGAAFYAAADSMNLEGIVSKRRTAPYHAGKGDSWVKTKCWDVAEFELLGIKREPGKITEAIVARGGKYAGSPAIAMTKQIRERLLTRMRDAPPPAGLPNAIAGAAVEWLQPGLTATVRSLRGEAKLRHGSVKAIRED
ncbi:DNA ligase [Mesorhizobium sp. ESP7-2]|uniref:ATP-dependent DNA ligase n=1 Tax=Mesorhizobium sp. ESP7-2 TaxID=2876622 RepID=UPI001CCDFB5A|nr:RNA ligase family protein [Mesorhizobium sp. ESP7-2]MBZ9705406.1 DNA ligase [Mesorhizobium sp. ESP7-2]